MNHRQERFVNQFTGPCFGNATEAARQAGYSDAEGTGRRLLREPEVKEAISAKTRRAAVEADQILARLAEQAFADGSLLAECYVDESVARGASDGSPVSQQPGRKILDWQKVRALGLGHLIRKITPTKYGEAVEIYDAQRALELLGRYLSLWSDRIQVEASVDLSQLSDEQLQDIAAGKPRAVLSAKS